MQPVKIALKKTSFPPWMWGGAELVIRRCGRKTFGKMKQKSYSNHSPPQKSSVLQSARATEVSGKNVPFHQSDAWGFLNSRPVQLSLQLHSRSTQRHRLRFSQTRCMPRCWLSSDTSAHSSYESIVHVLIKKNTACLL